MFFTASTVCGATVGPTEDFTAASMRGTGARMLNARAATAKIMAESDPEAVGGTAGPTRALTSD